MHFFLILCVCFFIYSFAIRRRVFDFLTIYSICLIFFNVSTIFGLVIEPYSRNYQPASAEMLFATSLIFLSVTPFLYFKNSPVMYKPLTENIYKFEDRVSIYLMLLTSLIFLGLTLPSILSASNKKEVLESGGIVYSLIGALPVVGAFYAFLNKRWVLMVLFLLMVISIFLLGSRRPAALAFIGFLLLFMGGKKINLISYWRLALFALLGILVLILGKSLYSFILIYGVDGAFLWFQNFKIEYLLRGSEFLSTPGILGAIISSDLDVSGEHMLKSLLAIQPIPLSYFNFSSAAFNDVFQGTLFPGLDYGMAYNPWGEAYAWLGYLGIIIYGVTIPVILLWLWSGYNRYIGMFKVLFLIVGVLLVFWIHRNSLASELAYIRNAIYPLLFIYLISKLVVFLVPTKKCY